MCERICGLTDECRICHNRDGNRTHIAKEMQFGTLEEFAYLECADCGCLQIASVPDDLAGHYPRDYYSFGPLDPPKPTRLMSFLKHHHAGWQIGKPDVVGWLTAKRFAHWRIPWLEHTKVDFDQPILDVGCGSGAMLHTLSVLGYSNLTGVDPFVDEDLSYPNGIRVLKLHLSEVSESYRLVYCSHAFEHMPDPLASLKQMRRVLDSDGWVVLRIPVSDCAAWKTYGVNWVQLDAPRHLYLHNERTIAALADQCGLRVDKVEYDSTAFQFTGSEGYTRGIPLVDQRPDAQYSSRTLIDYASRARILNDQKLGDQATFYLRAVTSA